MIDEVSWKFDVESSKHFGIANPYQEEDWQSWKNE